jgi:hypothetical protein
MSLIAEYSVVVIGAGASVPFGAPDGLKLMDRIEETLKAHQRKLEALGNERPYPQNLSSISPIYWAWHNGTSNQEASPYDAAYEIKDLAHWLSNQTSDSIDDVIRHNPKYADKLKICIVYELLKTTHTKNSNNDYSPITLDKRLIELNVKTGPREQRNWIHRLINVARSAIIEARKSGWPEHPKIKIVSFNYDGILEYVLNKKWSDVENQLGNWTDVFEIYHPHGLIQLSDTIIKRHDLVEYLIKGAGEIAVVHDEIAGAPLVGCIPLLECTVFDPVTQALFCS